MATLGFVCWVQGPDVWVTMPSGHRLDFSGARLYLTTVQAGERLLAGLPSGYTLHYRS